MPTFNVYACVIVPVKICDVVADNPIEAIDHADDGRISNVIRKLEAVDGTGDVEEFSHYLVEQANDENVSQFFHSENEPLIDDVLRPLIAWYDADDRDDNALEALIVKARKIVENTY